MPEQALLLDRRRLGIALRPDQAAQSRTVLAGNLLPRRLAHGVAEADLALGDRVGEKDPPAVIRHSDFSIMRPALRVDRNRGAQIDIRAFEVVRPHLVPPLQEMRLPVRERALQRARAVSACGCAEWPSTDCVRRLATPGDIFSGPATR